MNKLRHGRYKDVVNNLKDLYTEELHARLVVSDNESSSLNLNTLQAYVETEMNIRLADELNKIIRRSVINDSRRRSKIYENYIMVIVDPNGLFAQMDKELEDAYQHGLSDGLKRSQSVED